MTALPVDPSSQAGDSGDTVDGEYHALSYADIVERLFREFEDQVTLTDIADLVRESRQQLQGSPLRALPELTERLARQRLTRLTLARGTDVSDVQEPADAADIRAIPDRN